MARRKKQNEDQSPDNTDNINNESDDSFGLPEVEYEPLKRDEPQSSTSGESESSYEEVSNEQTQEEVVQEEPIDEPSYRPSYEEEEERPSVLPKVLVIVVLLAIALGAGWWFFIESPKREAAKIAEQEARAKAERLRLAEEERLAELKRQEDEQRRADSLANLTPKEGSIETLTDRTRRYYVVVSSAIDDDLVMDYAKKLSKNGVNCTIIPPFGKTKFSRLAVDVKDSFADAQSAADALKGGDFGSEIWVVKY
ncbi:MAG TPA: hypothetical protein VGK59_15580 [Ohtaekwangia sp.]